MAHLLPLLVLRLRRRVCVLRQLRDVRREHRLNACVGAYAPAPIALHP
jgi:hypothetical protein